MLVNEDVLKGSGHVEFVSYSGRPYSLCSGLLVLRIDGVEHSFGYDSLERVHGEFPQFWSTGGGIGGGWDNPCAYQGEWQIDVERIPEQFRKYAEEFDREFNSSVERGCCGGCI